MVTSDIVAGPSQSGTEQVCPYCDGSSRLQVRASDINRRLSEVVYELRSCNSCGLMFVANPPADLGRYYKSDYYAVPSSAEALEPHLVDQRFKLDIVRAHKPSGSLLEIGPAIGMFCELAKRGGYEVSAIEYDGDCVSFMQEKLGIRAVQSADPAAVIRAEGRIYDVVCMWHVIEHLARPWEVLDAVAAHLAPDGIIVIAAPNPDAWQARILGRRWPHYDLPRHLFQIPMPWLATFAAAAGLKVNLATTRDEGSLYWNRFTWAMVMRQFVRWKRLHGRLWGIGLKAGKLFSPWDDREGKGATYTMVLQQDASMLELADQPRLSAKTP